MSRMMKVYRRLLTTTFFLMLIDQMTTALLITKDPMNVTDCLNDGTQHIAVQMPCGFTGAPANTTLPNWRIIRRAEDGSIISDVTRNATDINDNLSDRLFWVAHLTSPDNSSNNSFLVIGPVDKTYNQSSYQCSFKLDDHTIVKSNVGIITLFDVFAPPTILMTYSNNSTITVSLSSLPPSCGSSRYTATISPSHGTIRMINNTFITFTGLTSNSSYSITVRVVSPAGNGRPTRVTVMTKDMEDCTITTPSANTINVTCILLGSLRRVQVITTCTSCTSSQPVTIVGDSPLVISNLIGGDYTVEVAVVDSNNISVRDDRIVEMVTVSGALMPTLTETMSTLINEISITTVTIVMSQTPLLTNPSSTTISTTIQAIEKCPSDSLSIGAAVALSCSLTFLLSVTTTAIITFIITYVFTKNAFEGKRRGTLMQKPSVQSCINPTVIYDIVQPPSHTTEDIKLQQNPAYGTSDKVIMDNNPAYGSYQH